MTIKDHAKPNIVFFLIDDMGWKDVGFMGSTYYETPNIDRLAEGGMVFTDAYACPNCAPTRASLMSGVYPPRHGIYTVGQQVRGPSNLRKLIPEPNKDVLDRKWTTIAEVLKQADYTCGHVGKWHLGEGPITGPEGRGFDSNVAGNSHGHPPAGYFSPYQNPALEDGPENEYLTDRLTDEALRFIEVAANKKPFFLYFAHYAVHTPLEAKEEMVKKYREKESSNGQCNPDYAAMIESTDQSVGRIMDKLKELDITEETIVFFVSDNGGVGGYKDNGIFHLEVTSQTPLRGGKGMLYEGGVRVPMAVRWPGKIQPGTTCETPVTIVDFFPTLTELARTEALSDYELDGESLVPLFMQTASLQRKTIFWHFPAYLQGNKGTWRSTPGAALRHEEWKLIEFFEEGRSELYNLKNDISEKQNLSEDFPEKLQEMQQLMLQWREKVQAPVPIKLNPEYDPVGWSK